MCVHAVAWEPLCGISIFLAAGRLHRWYLLVFVLDPPSPKCSLSFLAFGGTGTGNCRASERIFFFLVAKRNCCGARAFFFFACAHHAFVQLAQLGLVASRLENDDWVELSEEGTYQVGLLETGPYVRLVCFPTHEFIYIKQKNPLLAPVSVKQRRMF